jgi:ABC-type nitrate/sulfonate/bicarbonate transport system permease component
MSRKESACACGMRYLASRFELIPFFPSMGNVIRSILKNGEFLISAALITTRRAILGLAIGLIAGVISALLLAWSNVANAIVDPYISLAKSIPSLALIPVFILWFGLVEAARIAFVAAACFFVVFISAAEAIPNVPNVYRWSASTLGASKGDIYRSVVLAFILPHLFGGIRNAATLSFAAAVASEFIGAQDGLGYALIHFSINYRMDRMIGVVVIITLLAVMGDQAINFVRRISLRWVEEE